MTDDDKSTYTAAVQCFLIEPEALTPNMIEELQRADAVLGRRAVNKHEETVRKAAEARHRAALGQPPLKLKTRDEMLDAAGDYVLLALVGPKKQIRALEQDNASLRQENAALRLKCADFDRRILTLEADRATRREPIERDLVPR
jgi:hypothetical protein